MSAHTADSQFSFRLPTLSYVDIRCEEPSPRTAAFAPAKDRKIGVTTWLSRQIAGLIARHRDNQVAAELAVMTDYELSDIGLSRGDLPRVFQPAFNEDLRNRGLRV
jgi:uncharacterized protein YjiS (DUF1127 family)